MCIRFVIAAILFQGHILSTVGCPSVRNVKLDQSASRYMYIKQSLPGAHNDVRLTVRVEGRE